MSSGRGRPATPSTTPVSSPLRSPPYGRSSGYWQAAVQDALDTAAGLTHRRDPQLPTTGGPAGNAMLTAYLGLLLLPLAGAELLTLVSVSGLISWHIALGAALVPPALAKTGSTAWRIARYYTGSRPYRAAGPPPLLLRLLGPLVVASTLAVLGTGLALVALGRDGTTQTLVVVAGHAISPLTLHAASFVVWLAATGTHVLARAVTATQTAFARRAHATPTAGRGLRAAAVVTTILAAAIAVPIVLAVATNWTTGHPGRLVRLDRGSAHTATATFLPPSRGPMP